MKIKTMNLILLLIAVFLFLFTIAMIVIFCVKGATPDILIEKVFVACVGEGGFMGAIQIAKVITSRRKENDN